MNGHQTTSSDSTLNFFYKNKVIYIPSEISTSTLQLSINPSLPFFDVSSFNSSLAKLFIHLTNADLNEPTKTILLNLRTQYTYFLTMLQARKQKFTNEVVPEKSLCTLDLAYIHENTAKTASAIIRILSSLTPTTISPADGKSISTEATAQLIGTILPLTSFFSTLNMILDQEYDILESIKINYLPPYFIPFLSNAPCVSPSEKNNYQITNISITKIGILATVQVEQIISQNKYFTLTATPFIKYAVSLSESNRPVVMSPSNSIVTLNCSQPLRYCSEIPIDMACLQALQTKQFKAAINLCQFYKPSPFPEITLEGILIPGQAEYSLENEPTVLSSSLPFILQPNGKLQVRFNSLKYNFGSKYNTIKQIIPFILSESETNNLVQLIENPILGSFTLFEKVLMGVSTSITTILLTIIACGAKSYSHKMMNRKSASRPHVVFRVATKSNV